MTQAELTRLAGMPLGTIIARSGLVPADQVEEAIKESVATGRRLGQVLVSRGLLTVEQLGRLLELQGRPRDEIVTAAPQKQLVRTIYKDSQPIVTLRCSPKGSGCAVDYELHADTQKPIETTVFSNRDAAYSFVEEMSETFRLVGCEIVDTIGDEPRDAA